MTKPKTGGAVAPQVDFLNYLEAAHGWGREEALAALGEYLLTSSEPGRRLTLELRGRNHTQRVA